MLDPLIQLAFNVHSNPGVFALLLGSGISRSSGIPTGWEVVLDLIRRVAALEGDDCEPDPEAWYADRYGEQPGYAALLDRLAPTPALRQQLLRAYFEPTDEEREAGKKVPTPAHRAIARMVRDGAFRVIMTTNFDRLMEASLEAEGIVPTIISNADDVNGAVPIVHANCTVLKLHGDYLDTRIKNSPTELSVYDKKLNNLLDRILDEFGLIICGWSADYDTALGAAIRRTPSRRYSLFWTKRGVLSDKASDLARRRTAAIIDINDADEFFTRLQEKHLAIRQYSEPHPLSTVAAISILKRYMGNEHFRIDLHDFVLQETKRTRRCLMGKQFTNMSIPQLDTEAFIERLRLYEKQSAILRVLFLHGSYWADAKNTRLWGECFSSIASQESVGGGTELINMRLYPALLLKYASGIGAVLSNKYDVFASICLSKAIEKYSDHGEEFGLSLHQWDVVDNGRANIVRNHILGKNVRYHTPMSDHIFDLLKQEFDELVASEEGFSRAFDKYEYIQGLIHLDLRTQKNPEIWPWLPVGAFGWRSWGRDDGHHVARVVEAEVSKHAENWPPLRAGLFGGDVERLRQTIGNANEWLTKVCREMRF